MDDISILVKEKECVYIKSVDDNLEIVKSSMSACNKKKDSINFRFYSDDFNINHELEKINKKLFNIEEEHQKIIDEEQKDEYKEEILRAEKAMAEVKEQLLK